MSAHLRDAMAASVANRYVFPDAADENGSFVLPKGAVAFVRSDGKYRVGDGKTWLRALPALNTQPDVM